MPFSTVNAGANYLSNGVAVLQSKAQARRETRCQEDHDWRFGRSESRRQANIASELHANIASDELALAKETWGYTKVHVHTKELDSASAFTEAEGLSRQAQHDRFCLRHCPATGALGYALAALVCNHHQASTKFELRRNQPSEPSESTQKPGPESKIRNLGSSAVSLAVLDDIGIPASSGIAQRPIHLSTCRRFYFALEAKELDTGLTFGTDEVTKDIGGIQVTGAAGFLGLHILYQLLEAAYLVRSAARDRKIEL
ncbi:hypothetical protein C8J56DRAFT_885687 [Mycena floridula]|nr:hypothetical protein C8J56DRAFT_885687 [Mycena floridula]